MIMKPRGTIALVLWFVSTVSIPAQSRDNTFVIRGVRPFRFVEGDPCSEIRATRRIVAVWKRGVRVPES
jgi:hypothetical protein